MEKTGCIIQELYDTKVKSLQRRSCLHDQTFELYNINSYIKEENTMIKFDGKKTGIFAAGVAFGTAGIKILTSKDAK